jgi:hypothetical protein
MFGIKTLGIFHIFPGWQIPGSAGEIPKRKIGDNNVLSALAVKVQKVRTDTNGA